MYDIAIVGAGPAAWSAALTARMRDLKCVVIAPKQTTGWLGQAERVDNYPGLPKVSGKQLLDVFEQQAITAGTERQYALVRQIMPSSKQFMLLADNEIVESKGLILAMGAARPKTLPGEAKLVGSGVSYCATCDGMFYRGKRVAVLSNTPQGVEESAYLHTLAGKVDYFPLKKHDISQLEAGISVVSEKPKSIEKTDSGLMLATDQGQHEYDGVFIFRPAVAMDQLLPSLKVDGAFITVDRHMGTNLAGVYAAGDCTGQPLQIAKAVGEGNIAALACAEYLAKRL